MDFKVGDVVYVYQKWVGIEECKIKELGTSDSGYKFARLQYKYGDNVRLIEDVFATYEDAKASLINKNNAKVNEYKQTIKDIPSLVEFMFDNTVAICEEYTDWEARQAVREKAMELLGLCLTD